MPIIFSVNPKQKCPLEPSLLGGRRRRERRANRLAPGMVRGRFIARAAALGLPNGGEAERQRFLGLDGHRGRHRGQQAIG